MVSGYKEADRQMRKFEKHKKREEKVYEFLKKLAESNVRLSLTNPEEYPYISVTNKNNEFQIMPSSSNYLKCKFAEEEGKYRVERAARRDGSPVLRLLDEKEVDFSILDSNSYYGNRKYAEKKTIEFFTFRLDKIYKKDDKK